MSKKFGKFLLGTAVIGTVAAAAAYYYYQKKEEPIILDGDDDAQEAPSRSYTSLDDISEVAKKFTESAKTTAGKVSKSAKEAYTKVKDKFSGADDLDDLFEDFENDDEEEADFTPLSETAKEAVQEVGKTVEEFFDDSDNAEGTSEEVDK